MDESRTWALTFTIEELCLVAALYSPAPLVGIADPFKGLSSDEVCGLLRMTKQSLVERGHLHVQPDGNPAFDAAVVALIEAASSARWTLVVTHAGIDGGTQASLIHRAPGFFVEQATTYDGRVVVLTAVRDAEALIQRTKRLVNLPDAPGAPGPVLYLEEATLSEARRKAMMEGEQACQAVLAQANLPSEARSSLAAALCEPSGVGSLATAIRDGDRVAYSVGLAWLVGPQGGWELRPPAGKPGITFLVPAATAEIENHLAGVLCSFEALSK